MAKKRKARSVALENFNVRIGKDIHNVSALTRGTKSTNMYLPEMSKGKNYVYSGILKNLKTGEYNRFYIYADSVSLLKKELRGSSTRSTSSKKEISMIQIKKKYPHLYEAIDEMGMDNGMNINDKATINEHPTVLNNANKLLKYLKGHTIEEVVIQNKISKNIASMEYGDDNALMEYTMGEDGFIQGVKNKVKYGKETQKLMHSFFEGKHTHVYA